MYYLLAIVLIIGIFLYYRKRTENASNNSPVMKEQHIAYDKMSKTPTPYNDGSLDGFTKNKVTLYDMQKYTDIGFDFNEVTRVENYLANTGTYEEYYLVPSKNVAKVKQDLFDALKKVHDILKEEDRLSEYSFLNIDPESIIFNTNSKENLIRRRTAELRPNPFTPKGKEPKYPISIRIEGQNNNGIIICGLVYYNKYGQVGRIELVSSGMVRDEYGNSTLRPGGAMGEFYSFKKTIL